MKRLFSIGFLLAFVCAYALPVELCLWCAGEQASESCCPESAAKKIPFHTDCDDCDCGLVQASTERHPLVISTAYAPDVLLVATLSQDHPNQYQLTDSRVSHNTFENDLSPPCPIYLRYKALLN